MSEVEQVLRTYRRNLSNNSKLRRILMNPNGYHDVVTYAKAAGVELADAMLKFGNLENLAEDELFTLFDTCLQANHSDVMKLAKKVQRMIYDAADIGIGVLEPEYDRTKAKNLVDALIDGRETFDNLKNLLSKESLRTSDDTIRKNSEAAEKMGLKTRIIRRYDGVGLRDDTKYAEPCKWCLEREGEWDNYADALADGAFNRHPGCGCYIEYKVGKTHTWSNSAGVWNDM